MLILYLAALIAFVCADTVAVASVSESPNQFVNRTSLSERQTNSAVTIEFKLPLNVSFDQATYRRLRELILRKHAAKLLTSSTIVTEITTPTTQATTTPELPPTTTEPPTAKITEPSTTIAAVPETTTWGPKRRRRRRRSVETTRRRRRRSNEIEQPSDNEQFELDDIQFVKLDPEVVDGVLRVSVIINKSGISDDVLWEIIEELNKETSLETELNFEINEEGKNGGVYRGLPDIIVVTEPPSASASALPGWRFFLGFLILAILFIVLIFAIFCFVRHRKEQIPKKRLQRTPAESTSSTLSSPIDDNGFPDGLIMRFEDALLIQEEKSSFNSASPQITPL